MFYNKCFKKHVVGAVHGVQQHLTFTDSTSGCIQWQRTYGCGICFRLQSVLLTYSSSSNPLKNGFFSGSFTSDTCHFISWQEVHFDWQREIGQ